MKPKCHYRACWKRNRNDMILIPDHLTYGLRLVSPGNKWWKMLVDTTSGPRWGRVPWQRVAWQSSVEQPFLSLWQPVSRRSIQSISHTMTSSIRYMVDEQKWALYDWIWILYSLQISMLYILQLHISTVVILASHVDGISFRPVANEEDDLSLLSILVFSFGFSVGKCDHRR